MGVKHFRVLEMSHSRLCWQDIIIYQLQIPVFAVLVYNILIVFNFCEHRSFLPSITTGVVARGSDRIVAIFWKVRIDLNAIPLWQS